MLCFVECFRREIACGEATVICNYNISNAVSIQKTNMATWDEHTTEG